ncbi:membrane-bound transcription factor site-2 protease homolog [Mercurialis annua]|uniref:membrane-bound transcription factor site-2 protease homolog n=1 Tax=Mercurialis annua TaxID=3986 RepID=UPI00215E819F|nr:membrane-bound transcription factor site-2 protease homolog [Mercurialis annua]
MEERRIRRFGRGQTHTLLPLQTSSSSSSSQTQNPCDLSNTISCWYCDYKITAFNSHLFRFGRRHAQFLKLWFSIGVGFTLTSLLLVTMILVWDLGIFLHLYGGNRELTDVVNSLLFGFSPPVHGFRVSVIDASYLFISTMISVSVHEFGHAISAASEGIQTEYVAMFIALLFPGALVAFNYELLQLLQRFAALRIYCAGIWHNAVCCAACGLLLFLLPLILSPFYMHDQSVTVLNVPSSSPLSGYLSPGDVIVSLDGRRIHNEQEWMDMTTLMHKQALHSSNHSENSEGFSMVCRRRGYCVPTSLIEESKMIHSLDDQSTCPDDLTEFVACQCFDSSKSDEAISEIDHQQQLTRKSRHCLNARDVVKLNKCDHGWFTETNNGSSCLCSQDEYCSSPVQIPGLIWAEITYLRPYSSECLLPGKYLVPDTENAFIEDNCGGTFVFVGNVLSMAHSVKLSAYQPRWAFAFGAHVPKVIEKILACTFQVSLTVALLNSLPVYFLDGESILEAALCHFTLLGPRKREKVLQACLLGGTIISMLAFIRIFFINIF